MTAVSRTEGRCVLNKAEAEETLTIRYTYLITVIQLYNNNNNNNTCNTTVLRHRQADIRRTTQASPLRGAKITSLGAAGAAEKGRSEQPGVSICWFKVNTRTDMMMLGGGAPHKNHPVPYELRLAWSGLGGAPRLRLLVFVGMYWQNVATGLC